MYVLSHIFVNNCLLLSYNFEFNIAIMLMFLLRGKKKTVYHFRSLLLSTEIRQSEKAKKCWREMCLSGLQPSPS